ncbi:plasmid segregation protein ParM [Patescibacteria group bacterium]|nr:plasmid segregation protein ParM [Patescibacteria group bacterium]
MIPSSGDRAPHPQSGEALERAITAEEARLAEELAGLAENWGALQVRLNEENDPEERSKLLMKVNELWQKVLDRGRGPITAYAGFTQVMAALLAGGGAYLHVLKEKLIAEHARIMVIGEGRDLSLDEQEVLQDLGTMAEASEGLRNAAFVGAAIEQIQVFGLLILIMVLKTREPKP